MAAPDTPQTLRYVTDASGKKTDVLVPVETWTRLIASWQHMTELLEDSEDTAVFEAWLARRGTDQEKNQTLEEFEQELVADGLLPG